MKTISAIILLLMLSAPLSAYHFEQNSIDSLTTKPLKSTEKTMKFTGKKYNVTDEIRRDLNKIVDRHISSSNTPETWKIVKSEATDLLMKYYQAGSLLGSKPEQAFFVKIGYDTMTSQDIKKSKMILIAGVATVKPAEFEILNFERMVVGN